MPWPGSGEEGFLSICWASSDLFVQGRGFFGGWETQFCLEDPHTLLVLAQSGGTLTGLGVQLHQMPVDWLVQRVERQPAPGVGDGRLVFPLGAVSAHQSLQRARQFIPQSLGLEELPLVVRRAVAQREPGHKVVAIQLHRLLQERNAVPAGLRRRVAVGLVRRQLLAEIVHVQPQSLP
jgi:hypothetical protein